MAEDARTREVDGVKAKKAHKTVRRVLRKHVWDPTHEWCSGEGYRFPSPRFKSHEHHVAEEIVSALFCGYARQGE